LFTWHDNWQYDKDIVVQFELAEISRLASSDDNVAIATQILPAGTTVTIGDAAYRISHTVLEGHRFAIKPIPAGEWLLSWGQPFGTALTGIEPGHYICNKAVLDELGRRSLDFALPTMPNFKDEIPPFVLDEAVFQPAEPLPKYPHDRAFLGYRRPGRRGVGTRNMIVLLGTTSLTAGFVRALESRLKSSAADYPNVDAIVAVAHTEGGHREPNNRDLLLRTLAGFMIHPNVGAVLAVDYGNEAVTNAMLREYMEKQAYPLSDVLHQFMSLPGSFEDGLEISEKRVRGWLDKVNAIERTAVPLSELKIALQCGGSDAFSGISGNPLVAWVAREILRYGGAANLAETLELVGAESYVLQKVRDVETARQFLATLDRYQERVSWHGKSAANNPSGGNVYRGLYNIYLKSLGAAAKRHPDVCLDYVIDYAEPMSEPGYYFMNSPGNDLESIAGQVASGCNMIFFVTGNGSITNFPFVPTIKVVTTTGRYQMLPNEMDVNAGAYIDGSSLEELGQGMLDLTIDVISGAQTAGERAKHAQVQIWRDWRQTAAVDVEGMETTPDGEPLPVEFTGAVPEIQFPMLRTDHSLVSDQIGLVLPTSLCSGQIARLCVDLLNERIVGGNIKLSRFVTLVHTEGCGASVGKELPDTLLGYLLHPMVRYGVLLEHGCEKTHNHFMRHRMISEGIDPQQFGWASVQMDGGIQAVVQKVADLFTAQIDMMGNPETTLAGLEAVRLGVVTSGRVSDRLARALAELTSMIVSAGGSVVLPDNDLLLMTPVYTKAVLAQQQPGATLDHAHRMKKQGYHIMAAQTEHWVERLTGLGATGVETILAVIDEGPMPGHPFIPVIQVVDTTISRARYPSEVDAVLEDSNADWTTGLLDLVISVLSHNYTPRSSSTGNVGFQITRGPLGIST
jgi:altronate dehydratase